MTAKVVSPGAGRQDRVAEPRLRAGVALDPPDRSERAVSSKPSGSTGRTRIPGACASSASAMPEVKPPPPQQTSTVASVTPRLRRLFGDLEAAGALPRDHLRLVERLDQRQPPLVAKARADLVAILAARAVVEHHLRPVGAGVGDLQRGRVRGMMIVAGTP
jgi:hypothetical protein